MAETKTKTKSYSIKLTLGNVVLKGKGENMLEAIRSIDKPIKIFTKVFIETSDGKSKWSATWPPIKARNLFRKIAQPILAKNFEYLLK